MKLRYQIKARSTNSVFGEVEALSYEDAAKLAAAKGYASKYYYVSLIG